MDTGQPRFRFSKAAPRSVDLSRLITVSQNRGTTALSWVGHVVPKLSTRSSLPVARSNTETKSRVIVCAFGAEQDVGCLLRVACSSG